MPTRKAPEKASCELCCDTLEKGQDVLKCKEECGCVVHRYCAGATKRHFESLPGKGHKPFICQWCSLKTSKAVIEQLQSEVASLRSELATTKEKLAKQSERTARTSSPISYATVASQLPNQGRGQGGGQQPGRQRRGQQRRATSNTTTVGSSQSSTAVAGITASASNQSAETSQARVKVEGARRIWGTHPHATTRTVQNAIERFCKVQGLRIKRKTTRNSNSQKSSWWFVVHADEPVLHELDEKWESLNTQTSWTLKPCSKPADTDHCASDSSDSSASISNENPTLDTQQISTTPASEHLPVPDGESSDEPTVKEKPNRQVNPGTGNE